MGDEVQALLNEILSEVKALRAEWREIQTNKTIGISNKYVIGGVPLEEWLRKNNPEINAQTFYNRLRRGWTIERAAKTPNMEKKKYMFEGLPVKQWLAQNNPGISVQVFHDRLHRGWSIEEALKIPKGDSRYIKIKHEGAYHYTKSGVTIKGSRKSNIASEGKGRVLTWKNFVNKGENEDFVEWDDNTTKRKEWLDELKKSK